MTKEERRKAARRRQIKAWCIVIGIALAIFALGVLCGTCVASNAADKTAAPLLEDTAAPEEETVAPVTGTHADTKPVEVDSLVELVSTSTEELTPIYQANPNIPLSDDLQAVTEIMCAKHDVPLALILAIMERESNFNPDAVSPTNDYGLMQINKINFETLRSEGIDPLTYEGNIEAGCKILGEYIKRYGDIELALMAYNCGPTGARRLWDAGTYSTAYTRAVMAAYEKWQGVLAE